MKSKFLYIITLLSALMCSSPLTHARRAPLVIGIVVEGLDTRLLYEMLPYMGNDGIRRLVDRGLVLNDVDFGSQVDEAASVAMLMTGTSPAVNGISSELVFDRKALRVVSVVNDTEAMGNYTDATLSPKAIAVSTLADEFKIDGAGTSMVYAIAPDATMSIILAGHAANSAVWLNDYNGQWASTTYYKDIPTAVNNRNRLNPLSARIDTMQWTMHPGVAHVDFLPEALRRYPFRHTFPKSSKAGRYDAFLESSLLNGEITTLALDYINGLKLGKRDEVADMLNIGYRIVPFTHTKSADTRAELADAYLRLDADIARLIKAAGADAVIWMAGIPSYTQLRGDDPKWKLPSGKFSPLRATSLLNMNFIALHGNGNWVQGYHDGAFYFNEEQAKQAGVDMATIRAEGAALLRRMAGVTEAWTIDEISSGVAATDNAAALRRNIPVSKSGDVVISVAPGWEILSEGSATPSAKSTIVRLAPPSSFMAVMGPSVKHMVIDTPVDVRVVAPTLSGIIGVRTPSGASLRPVYSPSSIYQSNP